MTESEYRLLKAILDNDGAVYAREIVGDDCQVARMLVERGFLDRYGALDVSNYQIIEAGLVALADYEEARQKEIQRRADKQAQEERDRLQSEANSSKDRWFNLYSAIIGAVVDVHDGPAALDRLDDCHIITPFSLCWPAQCRS